MVETTIVGAGNIAIRAANTTYVFDMEQACHFGHYTRGISRQDIHCIHNGDKI